MIFPTEALIQNLINGFLLAGVYAVMGMGLTLTYSIMRLSSSAQAAYAILGAYLTYTAFYSFGVDPFLMIPVCVALFFAVGVGLQRFILANIRGLNPFFMIYLATYGVAQIIENGITLGYTAAIRGIVTDYARINFRVGPYSFNLIRILCAALAFTVIIIITVLLRYTRTGKAMRAVAQNRDAASLMGVNVKRIYYLTYGIGVALAGCAGPLMGQAYSFSPTTQAEWITWLYMIVVIGGIGSVFGTLVSAIMLGLLQMVFVTFLPLIYSWLVTVGIIFIVLLYRPEKGLFGT